MDWYPTAYQQHTGQTVTGRAVEAAIRSDGHAPHARRAAAGRHGRGPRRRHGRPARARRDAARRGRRERHRRSGPAGGRRRRPRHRAGVLGGGGGPGGRRGDRGGGDARGQPAGRPVVGRRPPLPDARAHARPGRVARGGPRAPGARGAGRDRRPQLRCRGTARVRVELGRPGAAPAPPSLHARVAHRGARPGGAPGRTRSGRSRCSGCCRPRPTRAPTAAGASGAGGGASPCAPPCTRSSS